MGKQLKTAQVSMEFVFLVGIAFTVMVVFIASTRSEFSDIRSEEERTLLKDACVAAQRELIIASNLEDGYARSFNVPEDLKGISYSIEIINNALLAYTDDYEYVLNIPSVSGDIKKGENKIIKANSTIYLNQ